MIEETTSPAEEEEQEAMIAEMEEMIKNLIAEAQVLNETRRGPDAEAKRDELIKKTRSLQEEIDRLKMGKY